MATTSDPAVVLITGAAGAIAYNLIFSVAQGAVFGDRPIKLHLLDIPPMAGKVDAVAMELEDLASPVLHSVVATTDETTAFSGVQFAMLVGARPRGPGMERKDLLAANASIFSSQGKALEAHADRNVKVCVVGNPANTNALITMTNAPSIPRANFTALTRLDQNRAKAQLAKRTGRPVASISNVIIWGNHSSTQYPDARFAMAGKDGIPALVDDDAWLHGDFIRVVQTRGAAVISARGASSAASAAAAICDHMRDWVNGSNGSIVSMGVCSDGNPFGVAEGLIFSMPVVCKPGGEYEVQALDVDDFSRDKLNATETELLQEKALALE